MIMRFMAAPASNSSADGFFKPPTDHARRSRRKCVFWEIGWGGAEVEVDEQTGRSREAQARRQRRRRPGDPQGSAAGQDEGAAIMGYGQAMFETHDL
jgi:hypothetical protein